MKTICTDGGPLIGMDRAKMHLWSGAFGKRFIGEDALFQTDYDAIGAFTDGRGQPIYNVTSFPNGITNVFLLAIPVDTAIIIASSKCVLIAQVESAAEEWSFSDVTTKDFEKTLFKKRLEFSTNSEETTFVVFDSTYKGEDVGDDCISFKLEGGSYAIADATYKQGSLAELNLFKIEKQALVIGQLGTHYGGGAS